MFIEAESEAKVKQSLLVEARNFARKLTFKFIYDGECQADDGKSVGTASLSTSRTNRQPQEQS